MTLYRRAEAARKERERCAQAILRHGMQNAPSTEYAVLIRALTTEDEA